MTRIADDVTIEVSNQTRWVVMDGQPEADGVAERCTVEHLRAAVSAIPGAEVVSATVNRTGCFDPPPLDFDIDSGITAPPFPPLTSITALPAFCDVRVNLTGPGSHVAEIIVWAPLAWNGRFMGVVGGGNRTASPWYEMPFMRGNTMPVGIRNGFAVASSDAGNRDRRMADWGLSESGEVDLELVRNWTDRSTHDMTLVGKAVTEALYGESPRYSYLQGCSGGGRQGLASAQEHPRDYDGIWSSDPAVNWTGTMVASLWPGVVMNELGNVLAPAKLDAFWNAAVAANDGVDGLQDGFVGAFDPCEYDPKTLVGTMTDAGEITALDAEVMRRVWEGPRRADGSFLWYGPRPCVRTSMPGLMWCGVGEIDGKLVPQPLIWGPALLRWTLGDPNFDWTTITIESFPEYFDRAAEKFSWIDANKSDLSEFRDHGAKLILSQGADDELLIYQPTIDYFRSVIDTMGGDAAARRFVRFFISDGDVHGNLMGAGPGLTLAGGMAALMNWVENDIPPEMIIAERMDPTTMQVNGRRPVYSYPTITRYKGSGDPADAESYIGVAPSQEANTDRDTPALAREPAGASDA